MNGKNGNMLLISCDLLEHSILEFDPKIKPKEEDKEED